jgi:excisionase family DNA binding protein
MQPHEIEQLATAIAAKLATSQPKYLSPKDYALTHSLGGRTVYRAIAEGRIDHQRCGRRVLIPVDAKIVGARTNG